jgi:putative transposase
VLTDGHGIPIALTLTGANAHDCPELFNLLAAKEIEKSETTWCTTHLCLDAGYISPDTVFIVMLYGMVTHIRPRKEEVFEKMEGLQPRRWVVERTHSWFNRYRRLLIRWEKRGDLYLGFLKLASCLVIIKRLFVG